MRRHGEGVAAAPQSTLPPRYQLVQAGPYLWLLRRPDGWPVASFCSPGPARERAERIAWRDYRRRTLRVIRGGATREEDLA